MLKTLFFATLLLTTGFSGPAYAQGFGSPDESEDASEKGLDANGKYIYLICIYGKRDSGEVPTKCKEVKARLRAKYHPKKTIIRIDNPSEERLKRLNENRDGNIAMIIVVTYSTPEEDALGWDVWDTDMEPSDIGECFEDEWVIWNGCYSKAICEEADNLLPVQCDEDFLPVNDNTWWDVVECLFGSEGPITREEVCEEVFGEDWRDDMRDDSDD